MLFNLISNAYAHSTKGHSVNNGWQQWNFDPFIILILFILCLFYLRGILNLKKRNTKLVKNISKYTISYLTGIIILAIALMSPIDSMSDQLAWVHMLQHTLILMVAAPIMVLGAPSMIGHWSFTPKQWHSIKGIKNYLASFISYISIKRPIIIWLLYTLVLLIWHLPYFYSKALNNEVLHDIQHIMFFVSAYFFWWSIFNPFRKKFFEIITILYPFIASFHGLALGAFMVFSPKIWYKSYIESAKALGYLPIEDQQIAGFIMWMPAAITYFLASIYIVYQVLSQRNTQSESNSK